MPEQYKTDLDLAPVRRTQANYYMALYFEAKLELQNANRGIERLVRRVKRLEGINAILEKAQDNRIREMANIAPPSVA